MPNMPTFWYRLRRCGILKICGSISKLENPSLPKNPLRRIERVAAVACLEDVRRRSTFMKKLRPACFVGSQRVVERADRIGRIGHLQDEVGERRHVGSGNRAAAAEQPVERDVELLERRVSSSALATRIVAAGAVAAPVHRPVIGHAAQALRRHRPLHRMVVGIRRAEDVGHAERDSGSGARCRRDCRDPTPGCRSRRTRGSSSTTPRRCST